MTLQSRPVFSSKSPHRWRFFLGASYIVLTVGLFGLAVFLLASLQPDGAALPHLAGQNEIYRRLLNPEKITTFSTTSNRAYRKARLKILEHAQLLRKRKNPKTAFQAVAHGVRAAFFVNWDAQSFYSLEQNIGRVNVVMPEWMFAAGSADTAVVDISQRALDLMRAHGVAIVPMISNFTGGRWNGENVHRILSSASKRKKFIASILRTVRAFKFQGVNVDFESLGENAENELTQFQRELAAALHPLGLLVTEDISPGNSDYNLRDLAQSSDYLVVMAYDMHFSTSIPGPIAGQKWVEGILDRMTREIPSEKILLGLAAYGYDWPQGDEAEDVTYEEAIVRAREEGADVVYDDNSYNLHFTYSDDNGVRHTVWFADAATTFNAMRAGEDYDLAGFALWRMGGEDSRIWNFYSRSLSEDSLAAHPIDLAAMERSSPSTGVDFQGEGEILDIVATPHEGEITLEYNTKEQLIAEESYAVMPTSYVIRKYGNEEKKIVLTFDDGPDPTYTPAIIDILESEHVPAAFFVIGENAERNIGLIRRENNDNFEIGNHTFSHPNLAEINSDRVKLELGATRRLIESVTGRSTVLFRAPYNADSEPETREEIVPIAQAKSMNFYTIGESIDPQDWEKGITADTIVARVIAQEQYGDIILLHDAGGDRSQTVAALPRIIQYFRGRGYTFTTVASLMGKTRDDVMPPLSDGREVFLSNINWFTVETISWIDRGLSALFLAGIVLSVGRLTTILLLAANQRRSPPVKSADRPLVSVVVPAYNEEVTAVRTVEHILRSTYSPMEVLFVDDGSMDRTVERMRAAFGGTSNVRIVTKPNGGKASALNEGIRRAGGEILVCIDADTVLHPGAVEALVERFDAENVGAVAGNVRVGNERNILTRLQAMEYITSQNLDRRAFARLNAITVVPGAIGAFRKRAVFDVGGFTVDTLAEDCDITMRLLAAGYDVRYADDALAFTEAPESVRMFLRQRFRWSFGILQSVWKHRDVLFDTEKKNLGWIALPHTLIFQFLLPLLSPLADVVMALSILTGNGMQVIVYYLLFLIVDAASAAIAFRFEQEGLSRLWLLLIQRFTYRQLMYWVLIKSILTAIRGTLVGWGVLKRTGAAELTSRRVDEPIRS